MTDNSWDTQQPVEKDDPLKIAKIKTIKSPHDNYTAWFEWAENMISRGWGQIKCPCCGLFHLWVKDKRVLKEVPRDSQDD